MHGGAGAQRHVIIHQDERIARVDADVAPLDEQPERRGHIAVQLREVPASGHSTVTAQSQHSHRPGAAQAQHRRSTDARGVRSQHSHIAVTAQTRQRRITGAAQTQHSHSAVTAQAQYRQRHALNPWVH